MFASVCSEDEARMRKAVSLKYREHRLYTCYKHKQWLIHGNLKYKVSLYVQGGHPPHNI